MVRFGLHWGATLFIGSITTSARAEVTALGFTAPIFATLLATLVLGEIVGARRWAAVLVGFGGTLLMGVFAGLVASACVAPALVTMLVFVARGSAESGVSPAGVPGGYSGNAGLPEAKRQARRRRRRTARRLSPRPVRRVPWRVRGG